MPKKIYKPSLYVDRLKIHDKKRGPRTEDPMINKEADWKPHIVIPKRKIEFKEVQYKKSKRRKETKAKRPRQYKKEDPKKDLTRMNIYLSKNNEEMLLKAKKITGAKSSQIIRRAIDLYCEQVIEAASKSLKNSNGISIALANEIREIKTITAGRKKNN